MMFWLNCLAKFLSTGIPFILKDRRNLGSDVVGTNRLNRDFNPECGRPQESRLLTGWAKSGGSIRGLILHI